MRFKLLYLSCLSLLLTLPKPLLAQLLPDTRLGNENSTVKPNPINNLRQDIEGGARRGTTLFHSFQEFNVNSGQSVYFNAPGITNIFTRVTGSNVSNIFGTLGVNGNGNLFLINPNGIIFGQGARLDLNGAFTATTVENLLFGLQGSIEFSAVNPQPVANNITINFPISFGFGNTNQGINTGEIRVEGTGHNLQPQVSGKLITGRNISQSFLGVSPGQNFNLVGRNITLNGGSIAAEGGQVTIAAIQQGTFVLENPREFNFDRVSFGNVRLEKGSLIDLTAPASSLLGNGSVQIQGETIELLGNSVILSQNQNQSQIPGGSIDVFATKSFSAIGDLTDGRLRSGIYSETSGGLNSGEGASISIQSPNNISLANISLENAAITSNTYSSGEGGNISLKSTNIEFKNATVIRSNTYGIEQAGEISITSDLVTLSPDARISSLTTGTGQGADISIEPFIGPNIQNGDIPQISSESLGSGPKGQVQILVNIFITPEVTPPPVVVEPPPPVVVEPPPPVSLIKPDQAQPVVQIEEEEDIIVSLLTRQSYQEQIETINRSCQPANETEDTSQFGIKDVFPTKKFLEEGGSWQFDIFITTDDRSKKQENWNEVILPNAVITATNGKTYLGLVCATQISD